MPSTTNAHTVRKVTVVTSTSRHSTRRPHRDHCHPGQPYHAHNTLLVGQYEVRIVLTLLLSSSGSLSEHQPVQRLQTLQFHSLQDCEREFSRISAGSENQLMGQSVRLNIALYHHYESVELERECFCCYGNDKFRKGE